MSDDWETSKESGDSTKQPVHQSSSSPAKPEEDMKKLLSLTERLSSVSLDNKQGLKNIVAGYREHLANLSGQLHRGGRVLRSSTGFPAAAEDNGGKIDDLRTMRMYADRHLGNHTYMWIVDRCRPDQNGAELTSPNFYLSPFGYCFQCKLVLKEEDIGMSVKLVEGHFDEFLDWPFTSSIHLAILNQVDAGDDICHVFKPHFAKPDGTRPQWSSTAVPSEKIKLPTPEVSGEVKFIKKDEVFPSNRDFSNFHFNNRCFVEIRLLTAEDTNTDSLLVDRALHARFHNSILRSDFEEYLKGHYYIFSVDEFNSRKAHLAVESDAFYTHAMGYCMKIKAKYSSDYLGIFIKLVPGEHDQYLKWPFTYTIELSLLNQTDESKHETMILKPSPADPKQCDIWSRPADIETRRGRGYPEFISMDRLCPDNETVSEFVRNDRLLIKVTLL